MEKKTLVSLLDQKKKKIVIPTGFKTVTFEMNICGVLGDRWG